MKKKNETIQIGDIVCINEHIFQSPEMEFHKITSDSEEKLLVVDILSSPGTKVNIVIFACYHVRSKAVLSFFETELHFFFRGEHSV